MVGFYSRKFYYLDNFSLFNIEYREYLYLSVEEAFQAGHFLDAYSEKVSKIKKSYSAHEE